MRKRVIDFLHYGKENAIPSKMLADVMGFRSVRDLQKAVEAERTAGAVILCDSHGAGYYLSDDPVELRRFTQTLSARAKNTLKAAESAQRALDAATKRDHQIEKAASRAGTSESGSDTNDPDKSVNDSGILPQKASMRND